MYGYKNINNGKIDGDRWVWKGLVVAVTLCLLIAVTWGIGQAQGLGKPWRSPIYAVADGSVTDINFDGIGDSVFDGQTVVVGFHNLGGPGEHRGVYEFDVSQIRNIPKSIQVTLKFRFVGTSINGTDFNLTLYACQGNGILDLSDYSCDSFVTAFNAEVTIEENYDVMIDVTKYVRQLVRQDSEAVVFVIRPNPTAVDKAGSLLFNSNETSVLYENSPTMLVFSKK